jgi:hypothetical protein
MGVRRSTRVSISGRPSANPPGKWRRLPLRGPRREALRRLREECQVETRKAALVRLVLVRSGAVALTRALRRELRSEARARAGLLAAGSPQMPPPAEVGRGLRALLAWAGKVTP